MQSSIKIDFLMEIHKCRKAMHFTHVNNFPKRKFAITLSHCTETYLLTWPGPAARLWCLCVHRSEMTPERYGIMTTFSCVGRDDKTSDNTLTLTTILYGIRSLRLHCYRWRFAAASQHIDQHTVHPLASIYSICISFSFFFFFFSRTFFARIQKSFEFLRHQLCTAM